MICTPASDAHNGDWVIDDRLRKLTTCQFLFSGMSATDSIYTIQRNLSWLLRFPVSFFYARKYKTEFPEQSIST